MLRAVESLLERRTTVYAACVASFVLGLFFIFVWTPLPWGWKGIDDYGRIAMSLARGEPFPTVHLVWGYAYFLAIFYRLFGDHPAIPLCAQALLNAAVPLVLYHLVRIEAAGAAPRRRERIAVTAAVLAGLFSFNTVYASTQASDSVCTVLVVAMILCVALGDRRQQAKYFAAAGLLAALAYQFRPNLLLLPPFLGAAYILFRSRAAGRLGRVAIMLSVFVIGGAPWVVRNYQWTGQFIPASTHGGVQLWFGTLQTGQYRGSWLYNPRAAFEYPPLEYTSITEMSVIVSGTVRRCDPEILRRIELVYWTSKDPSPRRIAAMPNDRREVVVPLPPQPAETAVSYYFDTLVAAGGDGHVYSPPGGPTAPATIVISVKHLGDLDVDGHALDVFDIVRLMRAVAWHEALDDRERLDFDNDGAASEADVRRAAALVVDERAAPERAVDPVTSMSVTDTAATLQFRDGSSLAVPRAWNEKITDLQLHTPVVTSIASQIVSRSRPFAETRAEHRTNPAPAGAAACAAIEDVAANRVPYRRLPHEMRRFTALALDNIRHDPFEYAMASAIRAVRVFIIAGSEDLRTAYQFSGAGRIYAIGRLASIAYLTLFVAGVMLAGARGVRRFMLLTPILYVPLTICFMLINARYSMTMQPFVFGFVAVTIVTVLERLTATDPPAVQTR
jgi:hypothetical protein